MDEGYKRYKEMIDISLRNFINEFDNCKHMFEDKSKRNELMHAGEYGMYKERVISRLLETSLPNKYGFASGFVVNNMYEETTQCDVIIYDKMETPFINSSSFQNCFFPEESVLAIGEVKSKLTRKQLKEAVIKLTKNAEIRKKETKMITSFTNSGEEVLLPKRIFTFLICDEVTGWDGTIKELLSEAYDDKKIDSYYRVNCIIALKNGSVMYSLKKCAEHYGRAEDMIAECVIATPVVRDLKAMDRVSFINLDMVVDVDSPDDVETEMKMNRLWMLLSSLNQFLHWGRTEFTDLLTYR